MSSSIEVTVSTCLYSFVSCGQTETLDRSADPTDCLTLSFSIRKLRNEKKTLMYKLEHKNTHSCCFSRLVCLLQHVEVVLIHPDIVALLVKIHDCFLH